MNNQCDVCTQYAEGFNQIADDLTEALGKWVGVEEAYQPNYIRPFPQILSKVCLLQKQLKMREKYEMRGEQ